MRYLSDLITLLIPLFLFMMPAADAADMVLESQSMEDEIASTLQLYVAEALSVELEEIEISKLKAGKAQNSRVQSEIVHIKPTNQRRLLGRTVFVITLLSPEGRKTEHRVSADIVKVQEVLVTRRKLRRLDIIGADDVKLEVVRTRNQRHRYEIDLEEVIGKRLRQSIRKGVPVRVDQLEVAPLVRRGDRVTLVFKSEGVQILTTGEAKQDGNLGETIKVVNLDSRKIVFGEVLNSGDIGVNLQRGR